MRAAPFTGSVPSLVVHACACTLPQAPHLPLLLPAATPGNVAMLLSGGDDAEAWKVGLGHLGRVSSWNAEGPSRMAALAR